MEVNEVRHSIAIEPNLTPIKDYLSSKGYDVESIDFDKKSSNNGGKFDAYIVSGMKRNILGIQDTVTKAIVIDASGLTPEQIYHELKLRLES